VLLLLLLLLHGGNAACQCNYNMELLHAAAIRYCWSFCMRLLSYIIVVVAHQLSLRQVVLAAWPIS